MRYPLIDILEPRRLLASIGGVVWDDLNKSNTIDEGENRFTDTRVYLDQNNNARLDPAEASVLTDSQGRYAFTGLSSGAYNVRFIWPGGVGQVSPDRSGRLEHQFDIGLNFTTDITASQMRAFQTAAARWEAIIVGDLPDVNTDIGVVDDIVLDVALIDIDGGAGTLAQAEPTRFRSGTLLPSRGIVEVDLGDVAQLEAENRLVDTITHEIAHTLGFGTLWQQKGLLAGVGGSTPRFYGANAKAAYQQLFNAVVTGVPVEANGGAGTALVHWRETSMGVEMMTPYSQDPGVIQPISLVTVQQFADLGYSVNVNAADPWNPLTEEAEVWTPADAGVAAFTRRVVVNSTNAQTDVDIGLAANRAPVVTSFSIEPSPVVQGQTVRLRARAADPDGDGIYGMTFYRESNGTPGLQSGSDTYVSTKFTPKRGIYAAEASTSSLSGNVTYYAVAVDQMDFAGKRAVNVTVYPPTTPPTRPNPLLMSAPSSSARLLQWKDRSDNEIGFRIELNTRSDFNDVGSVRAFNVPTNSASVLISDLAADTYYARIRSYNLSGSSAYTVAIQA